MPLSMDRLALLVGLSLLKMSGPPQIRRVWKRQYLVVPVDASAVVVVVGGSGGDAVVTMVMKMQEVGNDEERKDDPAVESRMNPKHGRHGPLLPVLFLLTLLPCVSSPVQPVLVDVMLQPQA